MTSSSSSSSPVGSGKLLPPHTFLGHLCEPFEPGHSLRDSAGLDRLGLEVFAGAFGPSLGGEDTVGRCGPWKGMVHPAETPELGSQATSELDHAPTSLTDRPLRQGGRGSEKGRAATSDKLGHGTFWGQSLDKR